MIFDQMPVGFRADTQPPEFVLIAGRSGKYVDVVRIGQSSERMFASLFAKNVKRVRGRRGLRGLVLCLIAHGERPDVAKSLTDALDYDYDFMVECLESCKRKLFVGEIGRSEYTAPWSMLMRRVASGLRNEERIVRVAKVSALPWQVRIPLLDSLGDHRDVMVQVIRECVNPPREVLADTDRADETTLYLERLMGSCRSDGLAVAFRRTDREGLRDLGGWAQMRGYRRFAYWVERSYPPKKSRASA